MKLWLSILILVLVSLLVAPFCGEQWVPLGGGGSLDHLVFWELRVPRVLLAFLCGAGLSVGGLVFQAMFRNALATPYTLGIVSGSTLSVAVWVQLGISVSLLGISGLSIAAFLGAIASVLVIYSLAKLAGGMSPMAMLLGGVVLSFFFASLTMLVQLFADAGSAFRVMRWLMGSLGGADVSEVFQVVPFVVSGIFIVWLYRKELDILSLGDELALSRGVEVEKVRKLLFIAVSLMVAGVVSFCGPIGFVGIMVPHFCRGVVGVSHQKLVMVVALVGGVFLVWCDTLARSLTLGSELPVGVVTSLLGGPFFLWMLLSRHRTV